MMFSKYIKNIERKNFTRGATPCPWGWGRGAQWAKSGGEAVLLQFSDSTKDPMHDFNRLFCWKSCDCEFWPYIMYLLQYKHEKVHASDDKSLKMNHATLIMKQNAAARWHCNAEYLMQRRISDVIFNDWQKKLMFQIPCHHSALLGTIPHFFRHFYVLIGQPVSP